MAATSLSDKDLQALKEQAEAQQRRRAPPLAGKDSKRRKVAGAEEEDEEAEGAVARFSYAAADAVAAGSTCLMASCGFNRQRSAAKELLSIVKPLLPEGTQLQLVKVGCRGLAVVRLEPAEPVVPLVGQVLEQIYSGQMNHTKFIERVIPAETTSLLTSVALEAALTKAATAYLSSLHQQQQQQQQQHGGDGGDGSSADAAPKQPLEFAVLYKSRGVDKQILAEMEKEAVAQQQQQQQQQQDQEAASSAAGEEQQQQQQQQEQAGPPAAAGAAAAQGLDRQRVIDLAAAVMERCCKDIGGAKVNLSKPQVVVMVEVLPLLRQQTACAVAMLPSSILSNCHKLKIKPTSAAECGREDGSKGGGSQAKKAAGQQGKKAAA